MVNTTAFPTRSPANPGFVHLNMVLGLSTESCLGWAAPCPSGACGEFERPSRSAKDQVAAETARRTCRASDWRPDKRPRTRRSAECGYAPSLFPPSARCSGGTCGSAGSARAVFKVERLSRRAAVRAGKAVSPAGFLQVGGAGRIIGEKSHGTRVANAGHGRYGAGAQNTHMARSPILRFATILALVGVGVNRIGKERCGGGQQTTSASPRGRREAE